MVSVNDKLDSNSGFLSPHNVSCHISNSFNEDTPSWNQEKRFRAVMFTAVHENMLFLTTVGSDKIQTALRVLHHLEFRHASMLCLLIPEQTSTSI